MKVKRVKKQRVEVSCSTFLKSCGLTMKQANRLPGRWTFCPIDPDVRADPKRIWIYTIGHRDHRPGLREALRELTEQAEADDCHHLRLTGYDWSL